MPKNTVSNRTKFYKDRFLLRFRQTHGDITRACRYSGIARSTYYNWLKGEDFAQRFNNAREEIVDALEAEAWRRGVAGVRKPLFYKGKTIKNDNGKDIVIREYSDQLLLALLRANAPEKYREKTETLQTGEVILRVKYDDDDNPGNSG
jgi:hypothetical protein